MEWFKNRSKIHCTYVWDKGHLEKQETNNSSPEQFRADLRALVLGLCDGIWLKLDKPWTKMYDNGLEINMEKNSIHHDKSKHMNIYRHFIRQKLEDKLINLKHISTKEQLASLLTKSVSVKKFSICCSGLVVLISITKLERGVKIYGYVFTDMC